MEEKLKVGDFVTLKIHTVPPPSGYDVMTISEIIGTRAICYYTDRKLNSCKTEIELDKLVKYHPKIKE